MMLSWSLGATAPWLGTLPRRRPWALVIVCIVVVIVDGATTASLEAGRRLQEGAEAAALAEQQALLLSLVQDPSARKLLQQILATVGLEASL